MPEITEAQLREYQRYQQFGTPDEVDGKVKKVETLEKDNRDLRDERRTLKAQIPAEGAVVLTGDDARRWDAFKALNKSPEELAAGMVLNADERKAWEALMASGVKPEEVPDVVKERDQLKADKGQRDRRDAITAAVKAAGWPEETVATLTDMRSLDGAVFEVKTEKVTDQDGKQVDGQVPYVTIAGQQATKLTEFAAKTDSLKGIRTTQEKDADGGDRWVEQPRGAGAGGGAYDPVKDGEGRGRQQSSKQENTKLALS